MTLLVSIACVAKAQYGNMFIHNDKHGHCSLFWVEATYIVMLL